MTTELQRAMAQYEEARIVYRKAVLASLNGTANGDDIRTAVQAVQVARAELARHGGVTPAARSVRAAQPERPDAARWNPMRWFPRMLRAS